MIHKDKRFVRHGLRVATLLGLLAAMPVAPAFADDVDVSVKGIENPLLNNVSKSLSVAGDHEKPWSANQVKRLYRLAPDEVKNALQPYGYYNPKIKETLDPPAKGDTTWKAVFTIDAGPPTQVRKLDLAVDGPGDKVPGVQQALKKSKLAEGKRLVQSDYTATKSALYDAAYQAGYLDAKFSQSAIRVNPKTNTAQIQLVLDTGERFYFGPVTFKQDLLNDAFVHRFVPFTEGQPFNADQLINMQLALSGTDYFSQIGIDANRNSARRASSLNQWFYDLLYPPDDPFESIGRLQVPVTVTAQSSKPQHYRVSGGYGTDTGPRVGLGVKFRHINQYGHQFSTDLRISQVQQALSSSYDIPIGNVATDKLSFTADVANETFGDITSFRYGIGAVRDTGWRLGRKRAYINLWRETYDLGDGNRTSTLLYPGYTFTLQKADNLLFTHKGVSLSLDARGGSSALLSSTDFLRGDASIHVVLPVTSTVRLVMRSEFGAITASDFRDVPPSQRFFAGGAQSVRGYSYQSISPTNADNEDIGGKFLGVASVETDYFFYGNFGVAAFFDAGDSADDLSNFAVKKGAGIGFRWASPVGMVRLDLAHPFDDPNSSFAVHFSLGPDL